MIDIFKNAFGKLVEFSSFVFNKLKDTSLFIYEKLKFSFNKVSAFFKSSFNSFKKWWNGSNNNSFPNSPKPKAPKNVDDSIKDFFKNAESAKKGAFLNLSELKSVISEFVNEQKGKISDLDNKIFVLIEEFIYKKVRENESQNIIVKDLLKDLKEIDPERLYGLYDFLLQNGDKINIFDEKKQKVVAQDGTFPKEYLLDCIFMHNSKQPIKAIESLFNYKFEPRNEDVEVIGELANQLVFKKEINENIKEIELDFFECDVNKKFVNFIVSLIPHHIEKITLKGKSNIPSLFIEQMCSIAHILPNLKEIDIKDVNFGKSISCYNKYLRAIGKLNQVRDVPLICDSDFCLKAILKERLKGIIAKFEEDISKNKNFIEISDEMFEKCYLDSPETLDLLNEFKKQIIEFASTPEGIKRNFSFISRGDFQYGELEALKEFKEKLAAVKKNPLNELKFFMDYVENVFKDKRKFKFPSVFKINFLPIEEFRKSTCCKVLKWAEDKRKWSLDIVFPNRVSLSEMKEIMKDFKLHTSSSITEIEKNIKLDLEKMEKDIKMMDTDKYINITEYELPQYFNENTEIADKLLSALAKQIDLSKGKFDLLNVKFPQSFNIIEQERVLKKLGSKSNVMKL